LLFGHAAFQTCLTGHFGLHHFDLGRDPLPSISLK
jgi:hypothetical protein